MTGLLFLRIIDEAERLVVDCTVFVSAQADWGYEAAAEYLDSLRVRYSHLKAQTVCHMPKRTQRLLYNACWGKLHPPPESPLTPSGGSSESPLTPSEVAGAAMREDNEFQSAAHIDSCAGLIVSAVMSVTDQRFQMLVAAVCAELSRHTAGP